MVPKKILLCTDFSENSAPARQYALEFAAAAGASLAILHVVNSSRLGYPAFETVTPFDLSELIKSIEGAVDKAFDELVKECSKVVSEVTTYSRIGVPAVEIVRLADEEQMDLIVMGTHGWTGFRHLILGSTAANVVRTAACPVLTVRPSDGKA